MLFSELKALKQATTFAQRLSFNFMMGMILFLGCTASAKRSLQNLVIYFFHFRTIHLQQFELFNNQPSNCLQVSDSFTQHYLAFLCISQNCSALPSIRLPSIRIAQHLHCLEVALPSKRIAQHQHCLASTLFSNSIAQHQDCLALALL